MDVVREKTTSFDAIDASGQRVTLYVVRSQRKIPNSGGLWAWYGFKILTGDCANLNRVRSGVYQSKDGRQFTSDDPAAP